MGQFTTTILPKGRDQQKKGGKREKVVTVTGNFVLQGDPRPKKPEKLSDVTTTYNDWCHLKKREVQGNAEQMLGRKKGD